MAMVIADFTGTCYLATMPVAWPGTMSSAFECRKQLNMVLAALSTQ
jgi:hypothetical protein